MLTTRRARSCAIPLATGHPDAPDRSDSVVTARHARPSVPSHAHQPEPDQTRARIVSARTPLGTALVGSFTRSRTKMPNPRPAPSQWPRVRPSSRHSLRFRWTRRSPSSSSPALSGAPNGPRGRSPARRCPVVTASPRVKEKTGGYPPQSSAICGSTRTRTARMPSCHSRPSWLGSCCRLPFVRLHRSGGQVDGRRRARLWVVESRVGAPRWWRNLRTVALGVHGSGG